MKDRISFSEWMSYRKGCQWRWKLDYLDKIGKKAYGVYMDFGTCVHGAIELHKTRKNPISLDDAKAYFAESFTKMFEENVKHYREHERKLKPADFVKAGHKILDHLQNCEELASAEVVYNEHELLLPIDRSDGVVINFKGFIDMVIKTKDKLGKTILYVVDFKTCSWGWDGEKRQDRDLHSQLFLYKHFLCKKFNLEPKNVRTAFILLKRRPSKDTNAVEFFPISAGPISVQRALDTLNSDMTDMKQRLETNTLQKNRKQCTNEYGDVCPYFNTEHCKGE